MNTNAREINNMYNVVPIYVNGVHCIVTPHDKSVNVRVTFYECNHILGENIPRTAVVMSAEDFVNIYNGMADLIRQLSPQPKLELEQKNEVLQ